MSQIIVSNFLSVSAVDASNSYLVESGAFLQILNGGLVSDLITVIQDSQLYVFSGGTTLSTVVSNGIQYVGGIASNTAISNGQQYLYSGGIAISTTLDGGGNQQVQIGGIATDTTIIFGGEQ
jgi:autotransporter passenger strand-loop-strand repeat protein